MLHPWTPKTDPEVPPVIYSPHFSPYTVPSACLHPEMQMYIFAYGSQAYVDRQPNSAYQGIMSVKTNSNLSISHSSFGSGKGKRPYEYPSKRKHEGRVGTSLQKVRKNSKNP